MAFVDDEDDEGLRSGFSGKIVGVLGVAAAAVAAKFLVPAFMGSSRDYTPDRVRTEIESDPGNREAFAAIRASYPTEYDTFLRRMADTANSTKDNWALRQQAFDFTRGLMRIHFDGLARAESVEIRNIALQYGALFRALSQSNVDLCGQAATRGFSPGMEVGPEAMAIINHIGAMQITAASHGEARATLPRVAMTEAETQQFLRAVRARSEPSLRLMLDDRAMASATPEQQCQAAIVVYEVIGALPPDDGAKATIQLLRSSLVPGSQTS